LAQIHPDVDQALSVSRKTDKIASSDAQRSSLNWITSHTMICLLLDLTAWTMFGNMEMCHEDIHRCSYVNLANRHPLGHSDRKRGPCVPGELRIRE